MLERTQANHEEMNFHFSSPHTVLSLLLLDEIDPMNMMSYSSLMKYMSSYDALIIWRMINPKPLSGSSIVDVQIT